MDAMKRKTVSKVGLVDDCISKRTKVDFECCDSNSIVECFRNVCCHEKDMKRNYAKFHYLDSIPQEIWSKIFQNLSDKHLYNIRRVSKKAKVLADFWINQRRRHLKFDYRNGLVSSEQLSFLCTYFTQITKLSVENPQIRFDDLTRFYSRTVPKLSTLKLSHLTTCTDFNAHIIADVFPKLTALHLICVPINDETVAKLFRSLPNLESIELDRVNVCGSCFRFIGSNLTSINWTTNSEVSVSEELSFAKTDGGKAIESFTYQMAGEEENEKENIASVIKRDMTNLKVLRLLDMWELNQFQHLCLPNLQELEIRACEVFGDFLFTKPILSLKKLSVNIMNLNEVNLLSLLLNFPNIEDLSLFFSIGCDTQLTSSIIEALMALRNLKQFLLEDSNYETEDYLNFDNEDDNLLIELLQSLTSVKKFTIILGNAFTNQNYDSIRSAVDTLRAERPEVVFETDFV